MNIYCYLNKAIDYIEENLENEIEYDKIARILGVNKYTLQKVFSIICGVSLTEYIRNRRLSNAGQDLCIGNNKIIDIAIKYQYNSPVAFSRAFEKFHGICPSQVKKNPKSLKVYTKLKFNENIQFNTKMNYSIVKKEELILYGMCKKTSLEDIKYDAPEFHEKMATIYGDADYGMVVYNDASRTLVTEYWVLYEKTIEGGKKYVIPQSKWIQIIINSQEAIDIQEISGEFYEKVFTSLKYNLRNLPELEYYHDGITEFLIPIEN